MVGNAKGWCNCNCLSIFKDNIEICVAVGRFCVDFWQTDKLYQDQTIIEWQKYTKGYGSNYMLPFAADGSEDPTNIEKMQSHKICPSALCTIVGISGRKHDTLKKLANTTGCAKVHGLKGKKSNKAFKDDSEEIAALILHFTILVGLGEVRATRLIRKLLRDTNTLMTRDDNDEITSS
mmetsp:Transcript_25192/g.41525  ORF Transcript_25192/g.41525 Transcript_25192/m.41525 type:complete len:178 (+) Transcript_25192:383-916(+)